MLTVWLQNSLPQKQIIMIMRFHTTKLLIKTMKTKCLASWKRCPKEPSCHSGKTEDYEYILKVKKKYTPKTMIDNGDIVTLNLMFKYYCVEKDDTLLQGYYAKILSYEEDKENNN